jgi:hypothetical protein
VYVASGAGSDRLSSSAVCVAGASSCHATWPVFQNVSSQTSHLLDTKGCMLQLLGFCRTFNCLLSLILLFLI